MPSSLTISTLLTSSLSSSSLLTVTLKASSLSYISLLVSTPWLDITLSLSLMWSDVLEYGVFKPASALRCSVTWVPPCAWSILSPQCQRLLLHGLELMWRACMIFPSLLAVEFNFAKWATMFRFPAYMRVPRFIPMNLHIANHTYMSIYDQTFLCMLIFNMFYQLVSTFTFLVTGDTLVSSPCIHGRLMLLFIVVNEGDLIIGHFIALCALELIFRGNLFILTPW